MRLGAEGFGGKRPGDACIALWDWPDGNHCPGNWNWPCKGVCVGLASGCSAPWCTAPVGNMCEVAASCLWVRTSLLSPETDVDAVDTAAKFP